MIDTLGIADDTPLSAVDIARLLLANYRESHDQLVATLRSHRRLLLQLQRGDRATKDEIRSALSDLTARETRSALVAGLFERLRARFEAEYGAGR